MCDNDAVTFSYGACFEDGGGVRTAKIRVRSTETTGTVSLVVPLAVSMLAPMMVPLVVTMPVPTTCLCSILTVSTREGTTLQFPHSRLCIIYIIVT